MLRPLVLLAILFAANSGHANGVDRRQTLGGILHLLLAPKPSSSPQVLPPVSLPAVTISPETFQLRQSQISQLLSEEVFEFERSLRHLKPSPMGQMSLHGFYGPGYLDVIQDWARANPEAAAPIQQDLKEWYAKVEGSQKHHTEPGWVHHQDRSYFERSFFPKLQKRMTQFPWARGDNHPGRWTQVFGDRLIQLEIELANELGASLSQVQIAVHDLWDESKREFILRELRDDQSKSKSLYSQEFLDRYLEKLSTFAPDMSERIRRRNNISQGRFELLMEYEYAHFAERVPHHVEREFSFLKNALGINLQVMSHSAITSPFETYCILPDGTRTDQIEWNSANKSAVSACYGQALEQLDRARKRLRQLPQSLIRDHGIALFDELFELTTDEFATFPQRLQATKMISERKISSMDIPETSNSRAWLQFGFSNAEEARAGALDWAEQVRSIGQTWQGIDAVLALIEPSPIQGDEAKAEIELKSPLALPAPNPLDKCEEILSESPEPVPALKKN